MKRVLVWGVTLLALLALSVSAIAAEFNIDDWEYLYRPGIYEIVLHNYLGSETDLTIPSSIRYQLEQDYSPHNYRICVSEYTKFDNASRTGHRMKSITLNGVKILAIDSDRYSNECHPAWGKEIESITFTDVSSELLSLSYLFYEYKSLKSLTINGSFTIPASAMQMMFYGAELERITVGEDFNWDKSCNLYVPTLKRWYSQKDKDYYSTATVLTRKNIADTYILTDMEPVITEKNVLMFLNGIGSHVIYLFDVDAGWETTDRNVVGVRTRRTGGGTLDAYSAGTATVTASTYDKVDNLKLNVTVLENMDTLYLPESLTVLSTDAFKSAAPERIILPDNGISVSDGAFADCQNLRCVYIPSTATVTRQAFGDLTGITVFTDQLTDTISELGFETELTTSWY